MISFCILIHAAKNIWKKRFFEEKRKTAALEEQVNRLRHEVDAQHKALMSYLENKGTLICRFEKIARNYSTTITVSSRSTKIYTS